MCNVSFRLHYIILRPAVMSLNLNLSWIVILAFSKERPVHYVILSPDRNLGRPLSPLPSTMPFNGPFIPLNRYDMPKMTAFCSVQWPLGTGDTNMR